MYSYKKRKQFGYEVIFALCKKTGKFGLVPSPKNVNKVSDFLAEVFINIYKLENSSRLLFLF